ncbi:hypothetical protein [Bacillus thuringiensis]|uniref:hypothetical protein n=1 Tax=Bacillus thuringiensis TaxID=1428 RepID=UPI000BED781D|nr:hypothetical protein [Bacillus thuringiensis]PDZ66512.1 hypothetical protein CON29_04555 [Bacillus thuringiensis]
MTKEKKIKAGYWSIATQKHLKQYTADSNGLGQLGNLNIAGKAGRFLGVIRGNNVIDNMEKLMQMANSVGISSKAELVKIILPELEIASHKQVELIKDTTGTITGLAEYVFTNASVLEITGQMFENQDPNEVERVSIETMDETKRIPYLQSELYQLLANQGYKEQYISLAIALQNQFKLIQTLNKSYGKEPIISNEYVWGANHHKIAMAVSSLDVGSRQSLKEIIEIVQKTQGYPIEMLSSGVKDLILLAKKTGMINPTTIISSRGIQKEFAFSAKMIEDDLYNDDIMDDVKLLLASIRFGEHYTPHSTIEEPEKFLSKLIHSGDIGPHSANLTDYTLLEKKGIVRVVNKTKPGFYGPRTGACLELIRKDVAEQALKIIKSPDYSMNLDAEITDFRSMIDTGSYLSPEEGRIRLGELPEHVKEVEDHLNRVLRGELL